MLLERERELAVLRGLIEQLEATGGKVVLIRGEAGIGKSALVNEFVRSLRDRASVDYGACDDLFIPQPFGPFWDMARVEQRLWGPLGAGDRVALHNTVMELLTPARSAAR